MTQSEIFDTQLAESLESPFPTSSYSSSNEVSYEEEESSVYNLQEYDSPFNSNYHLSEWNESEVIPQPDELSIIVSELYDEEFTETLAELVGEVSNTYRTQFASDLEDPFVRRIEAERYFEEEFEPIVYYVNSWLDRLAEEEESGRLETLSPEEYEQFIEDFDPPFEQGWLKRKARKLRKLGRKFTKNVKQKIITFGKTVGRLTKKGLKFLINKAQRVFKQIIPTFLKKVFQVGIRLLQPKYRPIAKLVGKLFIKKEIEEETWQPEIAAVEDVAWLQTELDLQIAQLLLTESEEEEESICLEYEVSLQEETSNYESSSADITVLDRARAKFIQRSADLEEGEDLAPIIEDFANTIRTAIGLAIKVAGRPRMIKLLSKPLVPLIGKLIPKVPKSALAAVGLSRRKASSLLSQAIVDVGFKIFNWELSPEEERMLGHAAIAATVEDVVREAAQFPEYILEDEDLFSSYVIEAFERYAAANLPPILPQEVYEENPELTEAFHTSGCWIFYPHRGNRPFICKKYSNVFEVEITPQVAELIKIRGGKTLRSVLRWQKSRRYSSRNSQLLKPRRSGEKANIHLYEAIPGTILSQIATQEQEILKTRIPRKLELHPLTPEVAGLLLGEPGLGREVSTKYLERPSLIAVGQRFFSLEILDEAAQPVVQWSEEKAESNSLRPSELRIVLDLPADQIRVAIFLREDLAHAIATRLRSHRPPGTILKLLRPILREEIAAALSDRSYGAMKIVGGEIDPINSSRIALQILSESVKKQMAAKLLEWLEIAIINHLRDLPRTLISAAEDLQDGITLRVFLNNPPGLQELGKALHLGVQMQGADFSFTQPAMKIKVISGYSHE